MDAPSGVHLLLLRLALISSEHYFSGVVNEASYFYDPSWPGSRRLCESPLSLRCPRHSALARKMFSQLDRSMN
jgi:hypothetical protein